MDESVSLISEPAPDIKREVFSSVFEAVKMRHPINFLYRGLKDDAHEERKIHPYHIVCQRGMWYVIGLCCAAKELRIFALPRMQDINIVSDTQFEKPADFNAENYIDKNMGVWITERESFTVRLLFAPAVALFAEERIWSDKQTTRVNSNQSVEVSFTTTQLSEIKRFVLGQGAMVQVLEPQELIDAVKAEAQKVNELYGG
ncbi:helix-turn-helix transcriptional regulator [Treponema phagedenis]|nr:WYL domain-containing protein [Treponema phagedenis]EFW36441.1 hypothetical protein HMPREF9554_03083 [Treponema phagedenis F0421]TYT76626.1 WYL domain-containing protein [Treponema phagedenis]